MTRAGGFFEAYVNMRAERPDAADKALMRDINAVLKELLPGAQARWAGSQRKGTAIKGSDLDICISSNTPITEAQRRALRGLLEQALERPAVVLSHALRLPAHGREAKVDVAFANAAFGSRLLPDTEAFHNNKPRQMAVRALKVWSRSGGMPPMPGWVLEALVLHLDPNPGKYTPLALFLRVIGWLEAKATTQALEGVLRPAASPSWNPLWETRLPGSLEAVKNQCRALRRRSPQPEDWTNQDDVERWLNG